MINLQSLLSPYRDAKSFAEMIAAKNFVAPGVFVTAAGHVGAVLALEGLDFETVSPAGLARVRESLKTSLRGFGHGFRIYQYLIKRSGERIPHEPSHSPTAERWTKSRLEYLESSGLFSIRLYMVVMFDASETSRIKSLLRQFSLEKSADDLDHQLLDGIEILQQAVEGFVGQMDGALGIRTLDDQEAFRFFREYLNPSPDVAASRRYTPGTTIAMGAPGTPVDIAPDTVMGWGEYKLRALVLKELPSRTLPTDCLEIPFLLRGLQRSIETNMVICTEWVPQLLTRSLGNAKAKRRIRFGQMGQSKKNPGKQLNNLDAEDDVDDLGQAQRHMRSTRYGKFSMTVLLFDTDEAKVRRALAAIRALHWDGELVEETDRRMRLTAFLATIPGNSMWQIRRFWLSTIQYVDLSLIYRLDTGNPRNEHLGCEYLSALQTEDGTPHLISTHRGELGHTLILGQQRSGKSVLTTQLVGDYQKTGGYTFILDIGGSYRAVTEEFGGTYASLDLNAWDLEINPLVALDVEAQHRFVRTLILNEDISISSADDEDLRERIKSLAMLPLSHRRLSRLNEVLPDALSGALHRWVGNGPYAKIFDNEHDRFHSARFHTVDFAGMKDHRQAMGPLMYYFFNRFNDVVNDRRLGRTPKMLVIDEGWSFVEDRVIAALKEWPKNNGFLVFIAHSEVDLKKGDFLAVAKESCPNWIFLPNPGADADAYGDTFGLNAREQYLLLGMTRPQILWKTPTGSRLLRYRIDPSWQNRYESQRRPAELLEATA